jgi:superfamily II DNA or RNA helicase
VLIEQNVQRLKRYGIPDSRIGVYYGQRKDADREITISTYQSVIHNFDLVRSADMVVLDEVHLVGATAVEFTRVFDVIAEDSSKALLGLTATIDAGDPKYERILATAPVVKRYSIGDAVADNRLARPVVKEVPVELDEQDRAAYESYSKQIRNISDQLGTSDPADIKDLLWSSRSWETKGLAREWFAAVRKRKELLSATREKLYAAADLIVENHPEERVMVFSETIESIERLKALLEAKGVPAEVIHADVPTKERQRILASWGTDFFPLLSVHTLEIGYDVPQVGVAIILATSNNQNRIAQRIGRVVRKIEGKDKALIYAVYAEGTKDERMLDMVYQAIGRSNVEDGDKS